MGLSGKRVVVTRAQSDAQSLASALEAKGAKAVMFPVVQVKLPDAQEPVLEAWRRRDDYHRFVIGSKSALLVFRDVEVPGEKVKIACVGEKTARHVQADPELFARFSVMEVASDQRSEGLAQVLGDRLRGKRFFLPQAREGRGVLASLLQQKGALVDELETYRIQCVLPEPVERLLGAAAITFMSGRTLACFLAGTGHEGRVYLQSVKVAVVGPVAAESAAAQNVRVDVVAKAASVESLVQALEDAL